MLTSQRDREEGVAGTFENPDSPSLKFPDGFHPIDLYVKGDNGKRADVLRNHHDAFGFIYVHNNIVSKTFVVKRNRNFGTNIRTMAAVSGNYFDFTPFKVSDKTLFSNVLFFAHTRSDDFFFRPSRSVFSSPRVPTLPAKVYIPNFRGTSKRPVQPRG